MDLLNTSIVELAGLLRRREITSVEITRRTLDRIAEVDPRIGAYVTVCAETALKQAAQADAMFEQGRIPSPLCGIPIAVKDIIQTRGIPTSCGTASLRDHVPEEDAAVVERLNAAGAVLLGKLATHEFAISIHPEMRMPVNPWGDDYWAGGSSNGAGAATAAGLCFGAIGTDTGGSIRVPSAVCGVTGLKPTFGRVSRYGVYPLSDTFDTVGPMARSAVDVAMMFQAIAAPDRRDWSTASFAQAGRDSADVRTLRVGVDPNWNSQADSTITSAIDVALAVLRDQGLSICEVALPVADVLKHWLALTMVEAAHFHPDITPDTESVFGPTIVSMVKAGRALSASEYFNAELARRAYVAEFNALFLSVDAIALPPMPRADVTEESMAAENPESDFAARMLRLNSPANLSGNPSLTLPCGFSERGLPLGVQFVGRRGADELLLRLGELYQTMTRWHLARPRLA